MNAADELVLNAFSAYIKNGPLSVSGELSDRELSAFMRRAMLHKLLPMAGSALLSSGALNEKQAAFLKNAVRAQAIGQTGRTAQFLKTYNELLRAGARPLCVKGIFCRSYYPEPDMRLSGDEDLFAAGADFDLCRKVLTKTGFIADKNDENAFEIGYTNTTTHVRIELHNALFDPKNEFFDSFNGLLGDVAAVPRTIRVDGTQVYAPADETHMLYLILHTFKHFIHAGTGIRQLCDIALFAGLVPFDWNGIFEKCAEVNADGFLNAVLLVGEKYFGLDLTGIKASYPAFDEKTDIAPLLDDVMSGAVYGADSEERQHSATITLNSVTAKAQGKSSSVLRSVFPPREKLVKKYTYLEKHPALLPAAWAHRLLTYSRSGNDASLTVEIGQKRVELMKQYKIIK